ncbi:amino acid permease-domain-containing protein [Aspergillus alliaceus]|uniref:amino acid permease-domain-containing protein n=1 Tax=Petromyces alliaceus TaxID=209559 RepID=UPI0012A4F210|nr:amino acid permease-domain-containing protein [Aspergillus alliaceus]KAB8227296.1 amino acid permease-domain-containing protein [Aspergillus alliaceus]
MIPFAGEASTLYLLDGHHDVGEGDISFTESQKLHRKLRGRNVELFAVGGAIGTSLFVQMGAALPKGGPAGLFLGFLAYGTIVMAVNECFTEMVCYMPIPSPLVRLARHWVEDALSFAMGRNFFLTMALNIPYEVVAINILLTYCTDKVPVVAVSSQCLDAGMMPITASRSLNVLTVRYFGGPEFYLSFFKIFLMVGLILYTFVTVVGGSPDYDAIKSRYWKDPGAFVSYLVPGDTSGFLGVSSCMIQGSFTRKVMRKAFASFGWRLILFFYLGALCIGIVVPYNDPTWAAMLDGTAKGSGTGAASPYVISMNHFGIQVLPDIANALIMASVLSAGNNVDFPPRGHSTVLNWLVSCITKSYLLNYFGTCITYLHFHASPGHFQPYTAWYALCETGVMTLILGYNLFLSGSWDLTTTLLNYVLIAFSALTFVFWKVFRRTQYVGIGRADLQLGGIRREIDEYGELEYARKRGKPGAFLDRLFE